MTITNILKLPKCARDIFTYILVIIISGTPGVYGMPDEQWTQKLTSENIIINNLSRMTSELYQYNKEINL